MSAHRTVVEGNTAPSAPYRETPPPCAACAARDAARAALLPFNVVDLKCPLCDALLGPMPAGTAKNSTRSEQVGGRHLWWLIVCRGNAIIVTVTAYDPPWWRFWASQIPKVVEPCTVKPEAGPHFHVRCGRCKTVHAMATAAKGGK